MFKQALRWITIGGIFMVPVIIPFIVSASMFFPYITGKNFTFRIIVEVVLAAWVLLALLDARYRPRFSWILAALVLFLVVVGIADLHGANPFKSFWSNFERMEGYVALLHLFAYFLVAATVLNTEKWWDAFWYSSLGASVAIAFVSLKPVFAAITTTGLASAPRIDATFGNPIYLAIYSLFHIFIALVLMVRWRGGQWHQYLLGVVVFLHLATMVLTQTRGTVLGFLGGAVITAILIAVLERDRLVLRKFAIGSLVALVLVVGAGVLLKNTKFAEHTPLIDRFTQISLSEGTIKARLMNWGIAWHGVEERPVLGWGQGNYEYVFSKYFDPNMYGQEPWFDRTHDIFFDWLVAAGFPGIITYLLIPLALIIHLWVLDPAERRWSWRSLTSFGAIRTLLAKNHDAFSATERALWTGLLAAYMFHNLFVFDNIVSYILYASLLAYMHWRVTLGHEPLLARFEVSAQTVAAVATPVTVVVAGFIIWYVNVPGITTAQLLIQALSPQRQLADGTVVSQTPEDALTVYKKALAIDQLGRQEVREQLVQAASRIQTNKNASADVKKQYSELAVSEMKRELVRNPDSARLWLFLGTLYATDGKLTDAEDAFQHAVDLTPTKQAALFQLAQVKLMLGKKDEGVALFKKAFEEAPQDDDARKYYAVALIHAGQDKEALDLLDQRYGTTTPVDDPQLFAAWTQAKRYDIVAQILQARIAKDPNDLQSKVSLAAAYKALGHTKDAISLLESISAANPQYKSQIDGFIKQMQTQQ